ncbi:histidine phosphatase family protein [uncultured Ilumatobacter sp.]|jgi:probable phosphoglycerate mutase|uniref:histidine phosphatase family protein n=1 Tax=Ilumatobacter sp. TaxID=1967498 RepID=UPI0030B3A513|tara:strand:- start:1938 stop:2615 length:678 start_codon:yes stop_codon:yes gene_type:complete
MELVFIRHGQPEWMRDDLNVENPPLTELGHHQAKRMAEALASEEFDEVLVSPLLRARQTAAPLYTALGCDEVIDEWLQEIGDPNWHGTPYSLAQEAYKELLARPSLERWTGLEGGESVRDFSDRIIEGANGFMARHGATRVPGELPVWKLDNPDQRIAMVAHAGTNSMALGHLLGVAPVPWQWERFQLHHTSITRLESFELGDGHAFGMSALGNAEHLALDDRTR